MAYVEFLNYGTPSDSPGAASGILGRSPGVNQYLADEIVRLCRGWGRFEDKELTQPVVLSFPLKPEKSGGGQSYHVVIKIKVSHNSQFQAVVINTSDFSTIGYNPYTLLSLGVFPDWNPDAIPGRQKVELKRQALNFLPPPSPEDVGLVDEALHQILASHKLFLPIEEPGLDSDRCLALLWEVIPHALKKQLRFASFAPTTSNAYHLAATATVGCDFSGWKRLVMTLVGGNLSSNLAKYVKRVRDCLAFGELESLEGESRLVTLAQTTQEPVKTPATATHDPLSKPAAASIPAPVKTKKNPPRAALKSPIRPPAPVRRPPSQKSKLSYRRGKRHPFSGALLGLLIIVATAGGGWTYLKYFHSDGVKWHELVSLPGFMKDGEDQRVTSLLEVPNVAAVYNKQIKQISRAGMIPGLSPESEQGKGVINLKQKAAIPLLAQVDLFLDLASKGIKQGKRPDREAVRLKALAEQGEVISVEMARLELAWHSLTTKVNWRDLGELEDAQVHARRDSLWRSSQASLRVSHEDMAFGSRQVDLVQAVGQIQGMSKLVSLFQLDQYSESWAKELYQWAEMVSPAASTMTRAYRNSAFALIRLKRAEQLTSFAEGPFVQRLEKGSWPAAEVADILPGLRRQVGMFGSYDAPPLLAGTLAWYQILENPDTEVARLIGGQSSKSQLHKNVAVQFDSGAYENYVQRLVYEALQDCSEKEGPFEELTSGGEPSDWVSFENYLASGLSAEQWIEKSTQLNEPFLRRWAQYEAGLIEKKIQSRFNQFEALTLQISNDRDRLVKMGKQGQDWSDVWRKLQAGVNSAESLALNLQGTGLDMASHLHKLEQLKKSLNINRPLQLQGVIVRLDQEQIQETQNVYFEFVASSGPGVARSEEFTLGPAAPAGSGWVGTVDFVRSPSLGPQQNFTGTVRLAADNSSLLTVTFPSLANEGGPGILSRPKPGQGGSLRIKATDSWFRNLEIEESQRGSSLF